MMTPMSEDGGPLREWSPLTNLLQKIPLKLFTQDINLTCIDVLPEFIAIGTDCGIVYWYNRETDDIKKLKCEYTNSNNNNNNNNNNKITCIKIISTVDYMIAIGNDNGTITIFQIPKNIPESLTNYMIINNKKKQIERYNICNLHKNKITTIEWSKNGMKLFTGDINGIVIITEIDYNMHLTKSSELLNDNNTIVQLSYKNGLLLVSTYYHTILVDNNNNNKIIKIGTKERKLIGKYGAVFSSINYNNPIIYACRPGLRLWQSNINGIVEKTLIFKDTLNKINNINNDVLLLNPVSDIIKSKRNELSFGILLPFNDDLLITYFNDIIIIINPITIKIITVICDLRNVIDVSCTNDEIFILESNRNIIRLSYYPDKYCNNINNNNNNHNNYNNYNNNSINNISDDINNDNLIKTSIIDLKNKIIDNNIITNIPFYKLTKNNIINVINSVPYKTTDGLDPSTIIVNAEEAIKYDEINNINNINIETDNNINDKRNLFQKINQLEFEDVVFNPDNNKKNKKTINNNNNNNNIYLGYSNDIHETHSSLMTLSIDDDYLLNKEKRNIENIQKDVENKEKLLADVLNFDLSEYIKNTDNSNDDSNIDSINYVSCTVNNIIDDHLNIDNSNDDDEKVAQQSQDDIVDNADNVDQQIIDHGDISYKAELDKLKYLANLKIENNVDDNHENNDIIKTPDLTKEHDFNVLSKEFVTSAISDDIDGWVIV